MVVLYVYIVNIYIYGICYILIKKITKVNMIKLIGINFLKQYQECENRTHLIKIKN